MPLVEIHVVAEATEQDLDVIARTVSDKLGSMARVIEVHVFENAPDDRNYASFRPEGVAG